MTERSDAADRRRALDPQTSFIVQAPAGSGKTGLLTQRFLRLLATVDSPEQIVAITFTRKAAAEMRRRIAQALEGGTPKPSNEYERTTAELVAAARARAQLKGWNLQSNPAQLRIHTIDAFCNGLAAQSPVLARAGAELTVADDARELYRQAALRTLAHAAAADSTGNAVDDLLLHRDNQVLPTSTFLATMLSKREQWLPVVLSMPSAELRERLQSDLSHEVFRTVRAVAAAFPPDALSKAAQLTARAAERRDDSALQSWRGRSDPPAATLQDLDRWRSLAALLLRESPYAWRKQVDSKIGFPTTAREDKAQFEKLLSDLSRHEPLRCELRWLREIPSPQLSDEQWRTVEGFIEVLKFAAAQLELVFRETGQVDYPAILRAALHAIRGEGDPTELALSLDRRIRHLLVDEFQDTSFVQLELLAALTAEWTPDDGRTLFCVGDPMQSIYRFRQAEVGLFLRVRNAGLGSLRLEPLRLQTNFRSQQRLVEWCNEVFAGVMPGEDSIARGAVRHAPSEHVRTPLDPAVRVHAVFTREPAPETELLLKELTEVRKRLPQATVGVLVRQRAHVAHLAAQLREQGTRFQAVELESLESRPVVRDLLALTRALLHEGDRTAWVSVLRSPMAGLTLADLAKLLATEPALTVRELLADPARRSALSADGNQRARRLGDALERALHLPGSRTLRRRVEGLWLELGGPATVLDAAALEDASACLDELDRLEAHDTLPCGEALDAKFAELFAEPDPRASAQLQIMTIHKAKGLEFDVVMLPGLGRRGGRGEPPLLNWLEVPQEEGPTGLLLAPIVPKGGERDALGRYVGDRQRECSGFELTRLLYVAATRARCELHLSGHVKTRLRDGRAEMGMPEAGTPLSLLWPAVEDEFRRQFQTATHTDEVEADRDLKATLRRLSIAWKRPQLPEPVVAKPLRAAASSDNVRPEFEWASEVSRHVGTVVHAELDRWSRRSALPGAEEIKGARPRFEKLLTALGVPRTERPAALDRVVAALERTLADPRGQWLFAGEHQQARTEYAVTGTVGEGIVDVVIDRTFVDSDGTRWIVDFKTSTHQGAGLKGFLDNEVERYREQLTRYANLLAPLSAEPIRVGLYFPMLAQWREWAA